MLSAQYDVEEWGGITRHAFDARVSADDMADTFMPSFRAGVTEGNVTGVMCAYNRVNGIPACVNRAMLTGLLRDRWGFKGCE